MQSAPAAANVSGNRTAPNAPKISQPVSSPGVAFNSGVKSAVNPGEFAVVVHAREESWISITADGKAVESELLLAGSERNVQARRNITIKVGNAGGIDLQFNGKKIATVGDFGEVKTVTFGPGGVLPNAPASASTP